MQPGARIDYKTLRHINPEAARRAVLEYLASTEHNVAATARAFVITRPVVYDILVRERAGDLRDRTKVPKRQPPSTIETPVIGQDVPVELGHAFGIILAYGMGQRYPPHHLLALPRIEGLFEPGHQLRPVGEGAVEGVGEVPPIQLVGGLPGLVARQGLDPLRPIPHHQGVCGMTEAQPGLACQEEPLPEVLGCLHTTVTYPFQEPVAAMLSPGVLHLFLGYYPGTSMLPRAHP